MKIPTTTPRYEVLMIKRNGVKQRVGLFGDRAKAVEYGDKFYKGRYLINDRMPGQIEDALKARYPGLDITVI